MTKNLWLPFIVATAVAHPATAEMSLTSASFEDGATLATAQEFDNFGCTGGNLSPQLSWEGAPEGTASYVVQIYDPDAPTGSGWWHWSIFNIPAEITSLPEGVTDATVPTGAVQGLSDYGATSFGGACPPEGHGPHRYQVTVYALPMAELPLDETASGAMVGYYARANALAEARVTGIYER